MHHTGQELSILLPERDDQNLNRHSRDKKALVRMSFDQLPAQGQPLQGRNIKE